MAAHQNKLIMVTFPLFTKKENKQEGFVCSYLNTIVENTKRAR